MIFWRRIYCIVKTIDAARCRRQMNILRIVSKCKLWTKHYAKKSGSNTTQSILKVRLLQRLGHVQLYTVWKYPAYPGNPYSGHQKIDGRERAHLVKVGNQMLRQIWDFRQVGLTWETPVKWQLVVHDGEVVLSSVLPLHVGGLRTKVKGRPVKVTAAHSAQY